MPKHKKFIDKKKSVTFQLRSKADLPIGNGDASQRVFVPVPIRRKNESEEELQKRMEEQQKYGIFFNDDSDYLGYLRDPKDNQMEWPEHIETELKERTVRFAVPPSEKEEPEEIVIASDSPPDLDPEIVAAMDDDFDFDNPDNQLDDNFIQVADGVASAQQIDEVDSEFEDDDFDSFEEEEIEHTSPKVIKLNRPGGKDHLDVLDARIERMCAEFNENQISDDEGALAPTPGDDYIYGKIIEEYENSLVKTELGKVDDDVKARILELAEEEEEEKLVLVEVKEKEEVKPLPKSYHNQPRIIQLPSRKRKLTQKAIKQFNRENDGFESYGPKSARSIASHVSTLSVRSKDETSEQRRERKQLLKAYRKERREEKKASKIAFKEESKKQVKVELNKRNNKQTQKIL